jgi:hypothetical protein
VTLQDALRALNEAAYAAARAASKAKDPRAPWLIQVAQETDRIVDGVTQ